MGETVSDQPVKPVRYDDNAVSYGPAQPQTVEVASGILSGDGTPTIYQQNVKGVASVSYAAGDLRVNLQDGSLLGYELFVQLNNPTPLPSTMILHGLNTSNPGIFFVNVGNAAGAQVDLSAVPWSITFSLRVAS